MLLIIERKDNESIDRALKRYKRKRRNVKVRQQLRERKQYTKPSRKRRNEIQQAIYTNQKELDGEI
ncbi:MAG: 30S ribosomal protein S21 [Saprospiraceae bacterium]|nr:30S ribosomal protein S21 [Saprospiraceae bacterium]